MILLWDLPTDPPLAYVQSALNRRGAPVVLIDQRGRRRKVVVLHVVRPRHYRVRRFVT